MSKMRQVLGNRVALALAAWVVYVLAFMLLYRLIGATTTVLVGLPVVVIGGLFGMWAGLLTGLLALPLSALLVTLAGGVGWDVVLRGLPGFFLLILVGAVVGRLRDLRERAKWELAERQRVEEELRKHRDHLEELVEERTAELASSEEFLNSVIEQSPASLWISDSEGTLIKMNLSCRELFGATDEEAVGKYNLFKDNLIEEQGFIPLVENVFEKGEIARFTIDYDLPRVEHVKVNGATHRILDVIISPVKDMHGKVTNAIVQHKDITERREAEEKLKQTVADLERTNAELERFNRLAVGRELRMIELKRQINELSEQLGKEPPYDVSLLE